MAAHNRYLRGDMMEILAPVRGKTVIEAGDFCYYHSGDSYYLFPFSDHKNSGASLNLDLYDYFAGVAMESSPAGTTENITIAQAGVFRYPMEFASAVTVGQVVSACSVTTLSMFSSNSISVFNLVTRSFISYLILECSIFIISLSFQSLSWVSSSIFSLR